jgi:hypothetical protein
MSIGTEYHEILKVIESWPAERKVSLAYDILGSVQSNGAVVKPKQNTLARALGLARVEGLPPNDEEVARMLDERRMEKYGR